MNDFNTIKKDNDFFVENLQDWNLTSKVLPKEKVEVETKIDDANGCRNEQSLVFYKDLWFYPDYSTYVYYTPTHWRYK